MIRREDRLPQSGLHLIQVQSQLLTGATDEDGVRLLDVGRFGQLPDALGRDDGVVFCQVQGQAVQHPDAMVLDELDETGFHVGHVGAGQGDAGDPQGLEGPDHGAAGGRGRLAGHPGDPIRNVQVSPHAPNEADGGAVVGVAVGFVLGEPSGRFLDVAVLGQLDPGGQVGAHVPDGRGAGHEANPRRHEMPELVHHRVGLRVHPGVIGVHSPEQRPTAFGISHVPASSDLERILTAGGDSPHALSMPDQDKMKDQESFPDSSPKTIDASAAAPTVTSVETGITHIQASSGRPNSQWP